MSSSASALLGWIASALAARARHVSNRQPRQLDRPEAREGVRAVRVELQREGELLLGVVRAVLAEQERPGRHVRGPVALVRLEVRLLEVVVQDVGGLLAGPLAGEDRVAVHDPAKGDQRPRVGAVGVIGQALRHGAVDGRRLLLSAERLQDPPVGEDRRRPRGLQIVGGLGTLERLVVLSDGPELVRHRDVPVGPLGSLGADLVERFDGLVVLAGCGQRPGQADRRRDSHVRVVRELAVFVAGLGVLTLHVQLVCPLDRAGLGLQRPGRRGFLGPRPAHAGKDSLDDIAQAPRDRAGLGGRLGGRRLPAVVRLGRVVGWVLASDWVLALGVSPAVTGCGAGPRSQHGCEHGGRHEPSQSPARRTPVESRDHVLSCAAANAGGAGKRTSR